MLNYALGGLHYLLAAPDTLALLLSLGRGFCPTFDANSRLARGSLDYCFVSALWWVVALQRLPSVGSDHFPLLIELALSAR